MSYKVKRGKLPWLPSTLDEQKEKLIAAVQAYMDNKVKEWGYFDLSSIVSYANSTNETYKAEALAAIAWRDAIWPVVYDIFEEIESGQREIPTAEELIAELPELIWPETIQGISVWKQPEGAHDAYQKGDVVLYNEKIYTSDIDNNIWSPEIHGWTETSRKALF